MLGERLVSAPAGSYTKRLFEDRELLLNKLLEESQELAEATEPDHVAAEAADLLFFALVSGASGEPTLALPLLRPGLFVRERKGEAG